MPGCLPQLAQMTVTHVQPGVQAAKELVADHNAGLVVLTSSLIARGMEVAILDANGFFESVLLDGPAMYNITEGNQPCYNLTLNTLCTNPANHLFWDYAHPTEGVHELLGELLASEIAI